MCLQLNVNEEQKLYIVGGVNLVKVNVKFNLEHAMKTQKGSKDIVLLFF